MHHHTDSGDCCRVEGIEAMTIFHRQGSDTGVVIGIPMKEDRLHCLPGQAIIGPTQLCHLGLRGMELLLDG
jgi:hypothetical protein